MKKISFLIPILFVSALAACSKEEPAAQVPPIAGLDLTKIQSDDYFRAHLDGAKELTAWCKQHINPNDTSSNEAVIRNLKNCENASFALLLPKVDIMKGKKYKGY